MGGSYCSTCGGEFVRGSPLEVWVCPACLPELQGPMDEEARALLAAILEARKRCSTLEEWYGWLERLLLDMISALEGGEDEFPS